MTTEPADDLEDALEHPDWAGWHGPSSDPNDRQFGDAIDSIGPEALASVDVALIGEPYDGAVIGRRGAREGPLEIRRSLAGVKTARTSGIDPTDDGEARIGDLGDLQPSAGDVAEVQAHVTERVRALHESTALPVFVGGDNSLTYANVAPLLEREGTVGVVNVDAHLDCRAVVDGPTSGTP